MPPLSTVRFHRTWTPLLIVFSVFVVGLFGAALWYTDARATITITPRATPVTATIVLRITDDASSNGTDVLPATVTVTPATETVTATPPAEGALIDARATGTMTIINTTNAGQPLVEGTRFQAENGVIVRTQKRADAPARGRTTVPVIADPLGLEGNLEPGRFTIIALNASVQPLIYGQLEKAMSGGQIRQGSTLDVATMTEASNRAEKAIEAKLGQPAAGTVRFLEPREVAINPPATEAAESYQVTVTMDVREIVYDQTKLETRLRTALMTDAAPGVTLLSMEQPTITRTTDADLSLRFAVRGLTGADEKDPAFAPSAFRGRNRDDITTQLLEHPSVASATVVISPNWQKNAPDRVEKIQVILTDPSSP